MMNFSQRETDEKGDGKMQVPSQPDWKTHAQFLTLLNRSNGFGTSSLGGWPGAMSSVIAAADSSPNPMNLWEQMFPRKPIAPPGSAHVEAAAKAASRKLMSGLNNDPKPATTTTTTTTTTKRQEVRQSSSSSPWLSSKPQNIFQSNLNHFPRQKPRTALPKPQLMAPKLQQRPTSSETRQQDPHSVPTAQIPAVVTQKRRVKNASVAREISAMRRKQHDLSPGNVGRPASSTTSPSSILAALAIPIHGGDEEDNNEAKPTGRDDVEAETDKVGDDPCDDDGGDIFDMNYHDGFCDSDDSDHDSDDDQLQADGEEWKSASKRATAPKMAAQSGRNGKTGYHVFLMDYRRRVIKAAKQERTHEPDYNTIRSEAATAWKLMPASRQQWWHQQLDGKVHVENSSVASPIVAKPSVASLIVTKPSVASPIVTKPSVASPIVTKEKKKKKKRAKTLPKPKGPGAPKHPGSAFVMFCNHIRPELAKAFKERGQIAILKDFAGEFSKRWKALGEEEKMEWQSRRDEAARVYCQRKAAWHAANLSANFNNQTSSTSQKANFEIMCSTPRKAMQILSTTPTTPTTPTPPSLALTLETPSIVAPSSATLTMAPIKRKITDSEWNSMQDDELLMKAPAGSVISTIVEKPQVAKRFRGSVDPAHRASLPSFASGLSLQSTQPGQTSSSGSVVDLKCHERLDEDLDAAAKRDAETMPVFNLFDDHEIDHYRNDPMGGLSSWAQQGEDAIQTWNWSGDIPMEQYGHYHTNDVVDKLNMGWSGYDTMSWP